MVTIVEILGVDVKTTGVMEVRVALEVLEVVNRPIMGVHIVVEAVLKLASDFVPLMMMDLNMANVSLNVEILVRQK